MTRSDPARASALADPASHLRFWGVVAVGLAIDLWSKHRAFHTLGQGGRRVLIDKVLEFHTTLNPGALFGFGRGQTTLFVVASVLALALVLWMFAQCPARRWLTQIALGAILAGALGNMYDRIFVRLVPDAIQTPAGDVLCVKGVGTDEDWVVLRPYPPGKYDTSIRVPREVGGQLRPVGHVRDFIKIPTRWFGDRELWPWVFNVADMLLVGGVGILAIRMLQDRRSHAVTGIELDAAGRKS